MKTMDAGTLTYWRERALRTLAKFSWMGPLLARLSVGLVFAGTGWGKLHGLDTVTAFFTELGIPAPAFQARMVAMTELVGGALITVGLATRLTSLPLAMTMVVAILTAKRNDITGLQSFFALEEFTYLAVFVWLFVAGAGAASVDALLVRSLRKENHEEKGE
jgi:putative oxidoreductase